MPKLISDQVRKRVVEIAAQHGFVVQLKDGVQDQYVKNLMFFCKSLNQTVYIRKDRAVGDGGIPAYFHVAVHPNFFGSPRFPVVTPISSVQRTEPSVPGRRAKYVGIIVPSYKSRSSGA